MRNVFFLALLSAFTLLSIGCNDHPDRPKTYAVTITILQGGQPVEGATIGLVPTDPSNQNSAYGMTDAEGKCEVTTYESGDGAVPGEYTVTVRKVETETAPDPTESNPEGIKIISERDIVPKKYNRPSSSGLSTTVSEAGDNTAEFNVD